MVQLDNLEIFLAVARSGSLAGAASALNVNQTTVYRRLRRYEQDIGRKLFDRSENGHALTAAGTDMFETAERIEREMQDLMRRLEGGNTDHAGRLTVTTTHAIADHLLIPTLAEFTKKYPEIVVELHTSQKRLDLEKREADVAIRPTIDPPTHLIGRKLISDTWRICCSKSYAKKHGIPKSTAEFADHRFIFVDEVLANYSTMEWLHDHVPTSQVSMVCNSVSALRRAVLNDVGIGQLPEWICDSARDQIQIIDLPAPLVRGEIWLLIHPDMRENLRLRTFTDFIKDRLETAEPHLTVIKNT